MDSIRVKRGVKQELPKSLPIGELAFCTDSRELYVGMGDTLPLKKVVDQEVLSKVLDIENGKRDKSVKITNADMDTSHESRKLGLINLQDEVIEAIAGTSPVLPTLANGSVTSEKISDGVLTPFMFPYTKAEELPTSTDEGTYLVNNPTEYDLISYNGNCFYLFDDIPLNQPINVSNSVGDMTVTRTGLNRIKLQGRCQGNMYLKLTDTIELSDGVIPSYGTNSINAFTGKVAFTYYDRVVQPGTEYPTLLIRGTRAFNNSNSNVCTIGNLQGDTVTTGDINDTWGTCYLYKQGTNGVYYNIDIEVSVSMWIVNSLPTVPKLSPQYTIIPKVKGKTEYSVPTIEGGTVTLTDNTSTNKAHIISVDTTEIDAIKNKTLDLYQTPLSHIIMDGGDITYNSSTRTLSWTQPFMIIDNGREDYKRIKISPGSITIPDLTYWVIYVDLSLARTLVPTVTDPNSSPSLDFAQVIKYGTYYAEDLDYRYEGRYDQLPIIGSGRYNVCNYSNLDIDFIGWSSKETKKINSSIDDFKKDIDKINYYPLFMPLSSNFAIRYNPSTFTLEWTERFQIADEKATGTDRFQIAQGSIQLTNTIGYSVVFIDLEELRKIGGGSLITDFSRVIKHGSYFDLGNSVIYTGGFHQIPILWFGANTHTPLHSHFIPNLEIVGNEVITTPTLDVRLENMESNINSNLDKVNSLALANQFPYTYDFTTPFVPQYTDLLSTVEVTGEGEGSLYSVSANQIPLAQGSVSKNGLNVSVEGNTIRLEGSVTSAKYIQLSEEVNIDLSISDLLSKYKLPFKGEYKIRVYDFKKYEGHTIETHTQGNLFFRGQSTPESPNNQLGKEITTTDTELSGNLNDVGFLYMYTVASGVYNCEFKVEMTRKNDYFSEDKIPNFHRYVVKQGDTLAIKCYANGEITTSNPNLIGNVKIKDLEMREDINTLEGSMKDIEKRIVYSDAKLIVIKKANGFYIYYKGSNPSSTKYIEIPITRAISESTNYDGWKIYTSNVCTRVGYNTFVHDYEFINGGEWECAIKIKGAPDFMGGTAHGDEIHQMFRVEIDGVQVPTDSTHLHTYECDKFKAIQKSKLYSPITGEYVADHLKVYEITPKGNINLYQEVLWKSVQTMGLSYLTMLPIARTVGHVPTGIPVTSRVYDNLTYEAYDISLEGHNDYPRSQKHGVTKYNLWSEDNESYTSPGISAEVEILKQEPLLPNSISFIQNSSAYNKVYYDFCGEDYVTSVDEKWIMHSNYKLNINS